MGVESGDLFSSLNEAWPLGSDQKQFGDDHFRNIKHILKYTFSDTTTSFTITKGTATFTFESDGNITTNSGLSYNATNGQMVVTWKTGGYGTGGYKIIDQGTGQSLVFQTVAGSTLYVTNGAGSPAGMTVDFVNSPYNGAVKLQMGGSGMSLAGDLTVTGNVIANTNAAGGSGTEFVINDTQALSADNASMFAWKRGGTPRWRMFLNSGESGSNSGSKWTVSRYADNGAWLGNPFEIDRSNGSAKFAGALDVMGILNAPNGMTATGANLTSSAIYTLAATGANAWFRLPHGTAPSVPANGDMWTTTAGLYAHINGGTVGPIGAAPDLSGYAPLASPALTGNPTAPTPSPGDNDTSIATTAFVTTMLADFDAGDVVGPAGATDNTVPRFDGGSGKVIQGSTLSIEDSNGRFAFVNGGQTVIARDTSVSSTGTFVIRADPPHGQTVQISPRHDTIGSATFTGGGLYTFDNAVYIGNAAVTSTVGLFNSTSGTTRGLKVDTGLLNLPHTAAPSSPTNGDVWTTATGMYARINGATVGPIGAAPDLSNYYTKTESNTNFVDAAGDTMTGGLVMKPTTGSASIVLDKSADYEKNSITGKKATLDRWVMYLGNNATETGSNAGSNFDLQYCDDGGYTAGSVLTFNRNTGLGTVSGDPTSPQGIATKSYVDTLINVVSVAKATINDSAPSSPQHGQLWWNSFDGNLYIYYNDGSSSQWVQINTVGA